MARNMDKLFQHYMNIIPQDNQAAAGEFRALIGDKTENAIGLLRELDQILAGDHWQAGSKNLTDALQFFIGNTIFNGPELNMGVGRGQSHNRGRGNRREDIVRTVANMISEDINFTPWTPLQKRMKLLAESYGFTAYLLPEA